MFIHLQSPKSEPLNLSKRLCESPIHATFRCIEGLCGNLNPRRIYFCPAGSLDGEPGILHGQRRPPLQVHPQVSRGPHARRQVGHRQAGLRKLYHELHFLFLLHNNLIIDCLRHETQICNPIISNRQFNSNLLMIGST